MLSIRDIIFILFKRKYIMIAFFLATLAGGVVALKLMTPNYAATAKLLVGIGREDIYVPALPSEGLNRPMMALIRKEQLNSEIQILTSQDLAKQLIMEVSPTGLYPGLLDVHPWYTPKGIYQRLIAVYQGIQDYFAPLSANRTPFDRALKRFTEKDIKAEGTGNSHVIELTVYSKVPQISAQAANRLVELFLAERGRIHSSTKDVFFASQLEAIETRLSDTQTKLAAFRQEYGVIDIDAERAQLLKRRAEIETRKEELETQIASTGARIAQLRKEMKNVLPVALHTQVKESLTKSTIQLTGLKTELASWVKAEHNLGANLGNMDARQVDFIRLSQAMEALRKSRKIYLEKLEESRVDAAMAQAQIGNVSVINRALTPNSPVSPKLWLILIAILAISTLGGIGLAFLFEFLDDSLESEQDVKKYLDLPVLAKVGNL